jgi:hypothetical protein
MGRMASHRLVLVIAFASSCVSQSGVVRSSSSADPTTIIHSFHNGLGGAHANNPAVTLRVGADSVAGVVLFVDYPAATNDPAARDVRLDAETTNWSTANAISFRVRSAHAIRLSVSFIDRNRVIYTSWTDLQANVWQTVRIDFGSIRPNPYFQPSGAKVGSPLDRSEVIAVAFGPQDPVAGRLAVTQFSLTK